MRLTRIAQDKGTLDGAENVALFSAPISGEHAARGRVVTESDWCCHSVQDDASGNGCAGRRGCRATRCCQNMLTRSRSAATNGSSVPLSTKGSIVPRQ